METGFKVADGFEGSTRSELLAACNELDRAARGDLNDPQGRRKVADLVARLESVTSEAVVARCVHIERFNWLLQYF